MKTNQFLTLLGIGVALSAAADAAVITKTPGNSFKVGSETFSIPSVKTGDHIQFGDPGVFLNNLILPSTLTSLQKTTIKTALTTAGINSLGALQRLVLDHPVQAAAIAGLLGGGGLTFVTALGITDPSISYSIGVTDFGAPSAFDFVFSIPLVPALSGLVNVHATLGVTLTAPPSAEAGGETIAPIFPNLDIMLSNVGACAADVDIGTAFGTPASTTSTHSFDSSTVVNLTASGCDPATSLTVEVAFQGSGNAANYGLTGLFEVTAVPEPASAVLIATGVAGLLRLRRRGVNHRG